MLSKTMTERLNGQINLEFYSSNLYLQMSSWCEFNALDGCARFLKAHAAEEMEHMQRLFTYVNETGGLAIVGQIDAPPVDFKSVSDIFQETYDLLDLTRKRYEMNIEVFFPDTRNVEKMVNDKGIKISS